VSGELCSLAYVNAVLNIPHLNQKRNYTIVREPGYRLECASATPLLSRNGVYKRIPRNLHRYAFWTSTKTRFLSGKVYGYL